jgi:hypothetical protein
MYYYHRKTKKKKRTCTIKESLKHDEDDEIFFCVFKTDLILNLSSLRFFITKTQNESK